MKTAIITATAICVLSMSQTVHADGGVIGFGGRLQAQTCQVRTPGISWIAATPIVALPTVATSALANPGDVAGRTHFIMRLQECMGTAASAAAFFESGSTVDPVSGNVLNRRVAGAATNVQLQLLDGASGAVIQAGNMNQHVRTTKVAIDANGNADLLYAVQYYATGVATAGKVSGLVTYSINYQ